MRHLLVIPTFNEAENIEKIITQIFYLYCDISILIVDDSSPDGTCDIVNNLKNKYSRLYLLTQPKKGGLARAYINGFKWGIEQGFNLFTSCDADFSHDPKYIRNAVEYINKGFDIVCGSRYTSGGNTKEKNWFKNFISIGGNMYADILLGSVVKDWTEGFNTYTISTINKINLDTIKVKGYIFQAEMKYKALKKGCKLKEFPISFNERTMGKSKMSLYIIIEALIAVIRIRLFVR